MCVGCRATPSRSSRRVKLRVVAVVHHDEAGVDVMGRVAGVDANRVRVPAGVGAGLVDDDLVLAVQQVRGDESGDARADDRDPHRALSPACRQGLSLECTRWRARRIIAALAREFRDADRKSFGAWAGVRADGRRTSAPMKRVATKTARGTAGDGTSEHQSLSKYIQARFEECSRSQKDVAQYIVDHLDEAAFQTAEELARRANTSSSTVVRFSQALGFEGFPELQAAAREEYRRVNAKAIKDGAGRARRRRCSRSTRTSSRRRSRPTT